MRRIEWLARGALVFLLVYGVIIGIASRSQETFPFFSWDLFSRVPDEGADYTVRINEAAGMPGPLPVYFEDANLQLGAQEIQGYRALQAMGKSLEEGDDMRSTVLRENFESTYLSRLSRVRYELVRRTYDIRKRVDCRTCFTGVSVIGTYTTG